MVLCHTCGQVQHVLHDSYRVMLSADVGETMCVECFDAGELEGRGHYDHYERHLLLWRVMVDPGALYRAGYGNSVNAWGTV